MIKAEAAAQWSGVADLKERVDQKEKDRWSESESVITERMWWLTDVTQLGQRMYLCISICGTGYFLNNNSDFKVNPAAMLAVE